MKLKMPSEIQLLSQFTMHILTKLSFKIKNITQKVPPILVVKVAFRRGVLPTNETETYPPKNTVGQGICEIAILKLDVDISYMLPVRFTEIGTYFIISIIKNFTNQFHRYSS